MRNCLKVDFFDGTFYIEDAYTADMGVDLGGLYVCMPQHFLYEPDVCPLFKGMGGKTVSQGMNGSIFLYASLCRADFRMFCTLLVEY
jgi:hypothetical protein